MYDWHFFLFIHVIQFFSLCMCSIIFNINCQHPCIPHMCYVVDRAHTTYIGILKPWCSTIIFQTKFSHYILQYSHFSRPSWKSSYGHDIWWINLCFGRRVENAHVNLGSWSEFCITMGGPNTCNDTERKLTDDSSEPSSQFSCQTEIFSTVNRPDTRHKNKRKKNEDSSYSSIETLRLFFFFLWIFNENLIPFPCL